MWRGKLERVPSCSSIHHSKFLIGLNPCVIHLRGFMHLIRGLGPLFGLFHSFLRMVHWYWSLWLGNLYLQYQIFSISIDFQFLFNFVLYFKNNKNNEINKKKLHSYSIYLTPTSFQAVCTSQLGSLGVDFISLGVVISSLRADGWL